MWEFIADNWYHFVIIAINIVIAVLSYFGGTKNTKIVKGLKAFSNAILKSPESIATAEKISEDAEERKTYVMDQAILNCKAEGVELTEEQLLEMSKAVDNQVALSKKINVNSKSDTTTSVKTITTIKPIGVVKEDNEKN